MTDLKKSAYIWCHLLLIFIIETKPGIGSSEEVQVLEDARLICEKALKKLEKDCLLYLTCAGFLFLVFLVILAIDFPMGHFSIAFLLRTVLAMAWLFCFMMGTLWNRNETRAILGGVQTMKQRMGVLNRFYDVSSVSSSDSQGRDVDKPLKPVWF